MRKELMVKIAANVVTVKMAQHVQRKLANVYVQLAGKESNAIVLVILTNSEWSVSRIVNARIMDLAVRRMVSCAF